MDQERWPRPLRAPDKGSGSGPETEQTRQVPRSPEELAKGVLDYLAERLGTLDRYHSDIPEGQIAQELHAKFGVYDPDLVYEYWEKMSESPSTITNPVLRSLAEDTDEDGLSKFDRSYVRNTLASVDTAWVPIRQHLVGLETTLDLQAKKQLLTNIKEEISQLIQSRKYTIYAFDKEEPLELRDLEYHLMPSVTSSRGSSVSLSDVAESLQSAHFDVKFRETLGSLDKSKLAEETLKYGAKGANLNELKRIQTAVREILEFRDYEIPDYRLIPASVHEKQNTDKRILEEVNDIYQWINKRKMIIRSSAVYSEDSENATGAGIYESIILEEGATLRDFLTKIKGIYKSVDSPEARRYRKDHGIREDEKMGLVVQEFIECPPSNRGYVNSIVKNVPELMEIVYEDGLQPIIVKERAQKAIIHGGGEIPIMHYEVDMRRKYPHVIEELAFIITLIEKHYGQPIQAEFLQTETDGVKGTYLVQTRFLPRNFSEKRQVEFPKEKPLFEGRAVGAFDLTLPVLSNKGNNRKKSGIVIFNSSKFYTLGSHGADRALPESGGVVILGPSVGGGGHIETICAEKGLALVFSDEMPERHDAERELAMIYAGIERGVMGRANSLDGYTTLRLVSNGLEGKVYGVGEPDGESLDEIPAL